MQNVLYLLIQFYHILFARRIEKLQELKSQILEQYPNTIIHVCGVDVRNKQEINDAISNLPQELKDVDVLVNNVPILFYFILFYFIYVFKKLMLMYPKHFL